MFSVLRSRIRIRIQIKSDPELFGRIRRRTFGTGAGSGFGSKATRIDVFLRFFVLKSVMNTEITSLSTFMS
jgi:hypothetical protein